jgi:hypothetical protein
VMSPEHTFRRIWVNAASGFVQCRPWLEMGTGEAGRVGPGLARLIKGSEGSKQSVEASYRLVPPGNREQGLLPREQVGQ